MYSIIFDRRRTSISPSTAETYSVVYSNVTIMSLESIPSAANPSASETPCNFPSHNFSNATLYVFKTVNDAIKVLSFILASSISAIIDSDIDSKDVQTSFLGNEMSLMDKRSQSSISYIVSGIRLIVSSPWPFPYSAVNWNVVLVHSYTIDD